MGRPADPGQSNRPPVFALTVQDDGVIRVAGELDLATVESVEQALAQAVMRGGEIHVDVSELSFLDSTGLRAFLQAGQQLEGIGRLVLHGPVGEPKRVLELSLAGHHEWIVVDWSYTEPPGSARDGQVERGEHGVA